MIFKVYFLNFFKSICQELQLFLSMESIISVFFGVCFPHAVERVELSENVHEFYLAVYEPLIAYV